MSLIPVFALKPSWTIIWSLDVMLILVVFGAHIVPSWLQSGSLPTVSSPSTISLKCKKRDYLLRSDGRRNKSIKIWIFLSVSFHFGNLFFGCFWRRSYQNIRYLIVCLFFILSCPSCLPNGKHRTENHATKVTKNQKWSYQNMWWVGQLRQIFFISKFIILIYAMCCC